MKDTLVQQCLDILKREDVKNECKAIFKPVIDFIFYEIQPYIYVIVVSCLLIFIMNLAILVLLLINMRSKYLLKSN